MARIIVVGGGISGLALAFRLEQRLPTAAVLVLEQQPRVGGTIRTDVRGWRAKLAVLLERFQPARQEEGEESIDAFARRRAGAEVAETLADAFVTGILAGDPTLLSLQASFPRVAAMEREAGSLQVG